MALPRVVYWITRVSKQLKQSLKFRYYCSCGRDVIALLVQVPAFATDCEALEQSEDPNDIGKATDE